MTIGDRVKARREELNMTQQELSNKMGYSNKSAISRIETSGNKISIKRVSALADALDCSSSYLMGWADINGNDINDIPEYDPQIQEVTDLFLKLNQEQKQTVLNMLRSFVG